MSMNKVWHVIGIKFNNDLKKDEFIDYIVENCDNVYDAMEKAKKKNFKMITGIFQSSSLVKQ